MRVKLNEDAPRKRVALIAETVAAPEEGPVADTNKQLLLELAEALTPFLPVADVPVAPKIELEVTNWFRGDPPVSGYWECLPNDFLTTVDSRWLWFDAGTRLWDGFWHQPDIQWRGLKEPHPGGYPYHVPNAPPVKVATGTAY